MLKKIFILAGAILLTACAHSPRNVQTLGITAKDDTQLTALIGSLKTNKPQMTVLKGSSNSSVEYKKLMNLYNQWAGTRYRLGGTGSRGIDCSALMQEVFEQAYGISLPRSTSEQKSVGRQINKHQLKEGDLVFFRGNRHVGVYLGNGRFMHASSSQGVTISYLSENYWARTYTQARRIL
ncbi:NlpC/P60 family protein [Pasteurellaceae bacterium 22721_9_1]